ncbi:hypothetical protein PHYC_03439 [Phycisphaerales bacterium]|nr:hypothetical protein PHYC_03439 [Phycisphaerales bacterium]
MRPKPIYGFVLRSRAAQVALVLAVCILVFWVRLGHSGLASSEGFRAIPAWEMLQSGDWLLTRLFDLPYLRKPPGIVWAIAASSSVLGQTEFAARAVSALATTLACLLTLVVGDRWFGRPRGLCAACAFALMPCFWMPSRSAEIEALHNFLALASAVVIVELALSRPARPAWKSAVLAAVGGVCIGATLLTKGPAAAPFLAAVLAGACVSSRSIRAMVRPWIGFAAIAGVLIFVAWYAVLRTRLDLLHLDSVTETARFLWRPGKELRVLALTPSALAGALPWAIALPFALAIRSHAGGREDLLGGCVSWAVVLGLISYAILGVDNSRYAMPAITFVPLAYAYALSRHAPSIGAAGRWGRVMLLNRPLIPILGFLALGVGYAQWQDNWREQRHSGRRAGIELGAALPPNASIVADELIDTRPEVLWYARREAMRRGDGLAVRWRPGLALDPGLASDSEFVAFRSDEAPRENTEPEWTVLKRGRGNATPTPWYTGTVHVFEFAVFKPGSFANRVPGSPP